MEKPTEPAQGTCVAIISEQFDSSGNRTFFDRWHGIVQSVGNDGYFVTLGGNKQGQEFVIPLSAELRPLPGGHFYFEESDEWVAPLFMYTTAVHATN